MKIAPPCPGCEQGPAHRHDPAEDPPRAECCAHTCYSGACLAHEPPIKLDVFGSCPACRRARADARRKGAHL